jgi:hypothetical protein
VNLGKGCCLEHHVKPRSSRRESHPRHGGAAPQLIGIVRQWIGLIIFATKRPCIGSVPSRPTILSLKTEPLALASVCEEIADNIEDHLTG